MKLTEPLKQEICDHFEFYDRDGKLQRHAGVQAFLSQYSQPVELIDFINFFNSQLNHYFKVSPEVLKNLETHDPLIAPLGEALHATQFELLETELDLACSEYVAIRFITAIATKDPQVLDFLINDPCYIVRSAVYHNSNTSKDLISFKKPNDTFFRAFNIDELEELGEAADEMAIKGECSCSERTPSDYIHEVWNDQLLELPPIAHEFEKRIRLYGNLDFGTQPLPAGEEDYRFDRVIDYLKGPIPDQYAVSHWGHGINSYSLNFRYALGDLAVLMQVGYGGVYGNAEQDAKVWDECVNRIGDIMILNPENRKEGLWQRKYLIQFSNFRINPQPHLWVYRNSTWTELPLVENWHDLDEFFAFWKE
jgi:hypothetical protein